nr:hypothetical protein Itr_chr09CG04800 [Ipomoea trifida]
MYSHRQQTLPPQGRLMMNLLEAGNPTLSHQGTQNSIHSSNSKPSNHQERTVPVQNSIFQSKRDRKEKKECVYAVNEWWVGELQCQGFVEDFIQAPELRQEMLGESTALQTLERINK